MSIAHLHLRSTVQSQDSTQQPINKMKNLTLISAIFAASALGLATPHSPVPEGYSHNLTLADSVESQCWLLTDEICPPVSPPLLKQLSLGLMPTLSATSPIKPPSGDSSNRLGALQWDYMALPKSPPDIRYGSCYVSWSKVVSSASCSYLHNAGAETLSRCASGGWISGLKRGV